MTALEALDSPEYVSDEEASPKQVEEQEAPPTIVEEAHPGVPEELYLSNIVTRVLSELLPQEEVAESEPSGRVEPDNAPIEVPEADVEEGRHEDEPTEEPTMQPTVHVEEEEV